MSDIITTSEAKCRDCYRCLRSCPVQAIGFSTTDENAQINARVDDTRCILDGRCVNNCPQRAKRVRDDRELVKDLLRSGKAVASIAPSFPGALPVDPALVPWLLRQLGFVSVHETATGAALVANEHRRLITSEHQPRPLIASSCPVVVNIVEQHFPEALPYLAQVVSPMVAHARLLRKLDPLAQVVFIGPCIAKKREAAQVAPDEIAVVLTFQELWKLWEEAGLVDREGLATASAEVSYFDPPHPTVAQLFPLDGGLLRTAGLSTDILGENMAVVSGLDRCFDLIRALSQPSNDLSSLSLIEMLACENGCISGPKVITPIDIFSRRQKVLEYHARKWQGALPDGKETDLSSEKPELEQADLARTFESRLVVATVPDESTIRAILARIGKNSPDDELNCGACGYDSCRSKAIAVHQGFARAEMCIPYMRTKAESVSTLVFDALPSGVVVVDRELRLLEVNEAAKHMFATVDVSPVIGDHVSMLTDAAPFQEALQNQSVVNGKVGHPKLNLVTQQTVFYVADHDIVVGIFIDITDAEQELAKVEEMKSNTITRAQKVISKQMNVAQEIAGLLGETTAETKVLLTELIKVINEASPARK